MNRMRRVGVTTLAALLGLALLTAPGTAQESADPAGPPTDYIDQQDALSQPDYPETVREIFEVPTFDDETIHVEVVMPDPEAYPDAGPWPVVAEASPYHGTIADRKGIRIFPDPIGPDGDRLGMTGYFAPRGYAVAMIDLRGTGQSGGCLDHLGQNDARDLTAVIEWLADQGWSTGEVGLTGHSYVGSTPSVAAAQRPEGLVTIAPSAGLASMYDHQFQMGTPYFLQYVGPMVAYEGLALDRHLPPGTPSALGDETGDDFGNNVDDTGCGLQNSALTAGSGQVTGQYQQWHAERDWRDLAAEADIPVFMIHGVNDNAARIPAAEWFFDGRFDRDGDKVWLGQWDHGSGGNTTCSEADPDVGHVNCRFDQWQHALHAWFDKHLKHMDVDTGPSVEAFLNDGTVHTDDAWSRPTYTDLHADATDGSLSFDAPDESSSVSFQLAATSGLVRARDGGAEFVSGPLGEDTVFMGLPRLELQTSFTNSQTSHLVTTLYREDAATGERHPMSYCTIQPQLRFGVQTVAPVIPRTVTTLRPQCFTMAHRAGAGDRLVLVVGDTSPHHVAAAADMEVTLHTGGITKTRVRLPVVDDAAVHCDVARFEGEPAPECVLDSAGQQGT